jgi:hypothetical protein
VKATFIAGREPLRVERMAPADGGMLRQYLPARLEDNPSMEADDPGYELRLEGLGSRALVQAMRWGDWDVIEGAFFDCWSTARHVVTPFEVPKSWLRFRSGDWGSAAPFSFGWWAVVTDHHKTAQGVWLPRGCLVRYREWYGMMPGKPNAGLKLPAEAVGAGLWHREQNDPKLSYGVLDPSAFTQDGGPSIHERIAKGSGNRIFFRAADNARVPGRGALGGWDQLRARLIGDAEGRAMIVTFATCHDSIRTIPALQHDSARPEDVDTASEDHAADEWRYAAMSRPWTPPSKMEPAKPRDRWDRPEPDERGWKTV